MKQFFRMDMPNTLVKSESELFEQAVLQRVEVIRNHMLGDFNEDGVYEIDGGIQNELLRMHKYLVERYDTQCLIESECIFDKRIYFSLKVEDNLVTFSVLEKMRYGTNHESKSPYCNIHTTILDQAYLKRKPKNLEELLFKRYNISIADTPNSLDVEEMSADEINEYFNTINRKLMVVELERELNAKAELLEEIEKEYYLETIHALKKSGAYGKQVISEMEQNMITVRPFINPKKPGYYKGLNQILNTVIHANRNEENKEQVAEFERHVEKPRKIYAEQLKKVVPVVASAITDPAKKQEKLEELVERITANQSQEVKDKQALRQAQKQQQIAQAGKGKGKTSAKAPEKKAVQLPTPKPVTKVATLTSNKPVETAKKTEPIVASAPAPAFVPEKPKVDKEERVVKKERTLIDEITAQNDSTKENIYDSFSPTEIFGRKINNEVDAKTLQEEAQKKFRKEQLEKEKQVRQAEQLRQQGVSNDGNNDERRTGVSFNVEDERNEVSQQKNPRREVGQQGGSRDKQKSEDRSSTADRSSSR